jgi:hypothetical protein
VRLQRKIGCPSMYLFSLKRVLTSDNSGGANCANKTLCLKALIRTASVQICGLISSLRSGLVRKFLRTL